MIYDSIKNIEKYNIPQNIIDFIKTLNSDTPAGHYIIDNNNYANVDTYTTKEHDMCGLEAHKKYIDIQILLQGQERLDYIDIDGLQVKEQYDENRDVMFFHVPVSSLNTVLLSGGKFAVLYPYEAHRPQMKCDNSACNVKKVVVKIRVD